MRPLFLSLLALSLCGATRSAAQVIRPYPIVVRITGYVGPKPEGVKSLERWTVDVDGAPYTMHVTELQPIGVDIAYWTILNRLEPLPIAMTIYGSPDLLKAFTGASPNVPVVITGNLELGPGPVSLLLRSVEPKPET